MFEEQLDLFVTQTEKSNDVVCEIFEKDEASSKFKAIFGLEIEILKEVLLVVSGIINTHIAKYNSTIALARFGYLSEKFMGLLNLSPSSSDWFYQRVNNQPRIYNTKLNVQFIFMTANNSLGHSDELLMPSCEKGIMTKECIDNNSNHYLDKSQVQTWIIYFPTLTNMTYLNSSNLNIPIEVVHPVAYSQRKNKYEQDKVKPNLYSCRMIYLLENIEVITTPHDSTPVMSITEDDFTISMKKIV